MTRFLQVLCSVLVLGLCVYLCYFKTDIGFRNDYMIVSGAPYWLSAIIFCIFIPIMTYFGIEEHINKEEV